MDWHSLHGPGSRLPHAAGDQHHNPMHALLDLIISLIAVAMIFFCLGTAFAGALQVMVSGAIMWVCACFVVMMLVEPGSTQVRRRKWLTPHDLGVAQALLSPHFAGLSGPRHSRRGQAVNWV
ncbi:NADH-quinone oxidoreductase subunit J [Shigella flexneri]